MDNKTKYPIKILLIIMFLSLSTIVMAQNDNDQKKNDHLLSIEVAAIYPQYWGNINSRADSYNFDIGYELGALIKLTEKFSVGLGYDRAIFDVDKMIGQDDRDGNVQHFKGMFIYDLFKKEKYTIQLGVGGGYFRYKTTRYSNSPITGDYSLTIYDEGVALATDVSACYYLIENIGVFIKINHYIENTDTEAREVSNNYDRRFYGFYPSIGIRYSLL